MLEDREKEGLVVQQIEKDHELSCHEIIRQHDTIIADLKRDNELLREENTLLRKQLGECHASKADLQKDLISANRYMGKLED